jgi:diaminopimelate decarboxylase
LWREIVSLRPVQEGELLTIENVGAYGLTASLVAFLGKPIPVEVLIVNGKVKLTLALKLVWEQCADARA